MDPEDLARLVKILEPYNAVMLAANQYKMSHGAYDPLVRRGMTAADRADLDAMMASIEKDQSAVLASVGSYNDVFRRQKQMEDERLNRVIEEQRANGAMLGMYYKSDPRSDNSPTRGGFLRGWEKPIR